MALNNKHATSATLYQIKSRDLSSYYRKNKSTNNAPKSAYSHAHANSVYGRRHTMNRSQTQRTPSVDPVHPVHVRSKNIARISHARSIDISNAQKVCKEYYFAYGAAPRRTEHLMKFATSIGRKLAYPDARLAITVSSSFNDMVSTNDDIINDNNNSDSDRSKQIENKTRTHNALLMSALPVRPVVLPNRANDRKNNRRTMNEEKHEQKSAIAGDVSDVNDVDDVDVNDVPVSLNAGVFDAKLEEEFNVLPRTHDQCADEKVINGKDRRKIVDTNKVNWGSRVGLLRMKFQGIDKTFVGTATVFHSNEQTKRVYAITCAHNLRHFNAFEQKHHQLETLWFENRLTSNWWGAKYTSSCVKRYNIDNYCAHYKFDPSKTVKPFDLGIVSFIDKAGFYSKQKKELNDFAPFPNVALLGYPGEKKGQLWGDFEDDDSKSNNHGKKKYGDVFVEKEFPDQGGVKMVSYDMQTTAGQSGSSIIFNKKIVAIHTMGSDKNWGIKLEKMHRDWIEQKVLQIEGKKNWGLFAKCPFQNLFG